jgi:putative zinc finger protein
MISILPKIVAPSCSSIRARFAEYLDSRLTGREMQRMAKHLENCARCASDFEAERRMLRVLASLGPVSGPAKEPEDLLLRIRVAISQERAQRRRPRLQRWELVWRNSIGPFLLQLSAGFASAVLLLGTIGLVVGMFTHPEHAAAQDEPLGMATAPRYLYHSVATPVDVDQIGTVNGPVVVEAYVNGSGRVYDYRIVSGPTDQQTRAEVENLLLFSVFEPARFFGQPVRGLAVLSFSGVSVHG